MYIVTFLSTHHAIAAERHCEAAFSCRLVPLPPSISAGCGLALKLEDAQLQPARQILSEQSIPYQAIYKRLDNQKYEAVL